MTNGPKIRFSALTLFPEMFETIKHEGVIARAFQQQLISLDTVFLRNFANNPRKNVDEKPIGGGDGMVLKADIAEKALLSVKTENSYVVHLTPKGHVLTQKRAKDLSEKSHIILLCGRYAGFDDRFIKKYADTHISLGDFVLSGGELPALCIIDTVSRLLPGVLGNSDSPHQDSFADGLLEAPQYTLPREFGSSEIPKILFSGDHAKIKAFQRKEQLRTTALYRPDLLLLAWEKLTKQEKTLVERIWRTAETTSFQER